MYQQIKRSKKKKKTKNNGFNCGSTPCFPSVKCTESVRPQEISPLVRLAGLISAPQKGKLDECGGSLDLSIIDNGALSGGSLFICQCETDVG